MCAKDVDNLVAQSSHRKNRSDHGGRERARNHSVAEVAVSQEPLFLPLFLMGCFPVAFQEVKRPLRTKSAKRPIKVGKRPINEGKRPIKAKVLVGVSVGSLMGCFRATPAMAENGPSKKAH